MAASRNPRPKKPVNPLVALAFSADGSVRRISEDLGSTQDQIERKIAEKFLAQLNRDTGRSGYDLAKPDAPPDWPDFTFKLAHQKIGLELAGITDPAGAIREATRDEYVAAIRDQLDDVYALLHGFDVLIGDVAWRIPFPKLTTREGRQLAQCIADAIRDEIPALLSVLPSQERTYRWRFRADQPEVDATFWRHDAGAYHECLIKFTGGFVLYDVARDDFIRASIEKKSTKVEYQSYADPLWLLAYPGERGPRLGIVDEDVQQIRNSWANSLKASPFDEVWYISPFIGETAGYIARIYP